MNRQVNYIIYAMLLSLIIAAGYFFIKNFAFFKSPSKVESQIADIKKSISPPQLNKSEIAGKNLFTMKCASCHALHKDGLSIMGFENRGPWIDRKNLYEFIRDPTTFTKKNKYAENLKETYGSMMRAFPDLTDEEIDAIVDYINYVTQFGKIPTIVVD